MRPGPVVGEDLPAGEGAHRPVKRLGDPGRGLVAVGPDDPERWLADEAVSAWWEPWTRVLLRRLTRHRAGVTAAAGASIGRESPEAGVGRDSSARAIEERGHGR